ncbi:unnamed protein product, partial [marine sediment metagenome]
PSKEDENGCNKNTANTWQYLYRRAWVGNLRIRGYYEWQMHWGPV